MSIETTCPNTQLNPLQMNGLSMSILAFPTLTYWVKDFTIPDISLPEAKITTPFIDYPIPGDKLEMGSLDVRIMADERLENYYSLYQWITLVGFPHDYTEVNKWRAKHDNNYAMWKDTDYNLMTDIRLEVKGANSETVRVIQFEDAIITNLGSITLTDEATDTQYVYFNASFRYRFFRFL